MATNTLVSSYTDAPIRAYKEKGYIIQFTHVPTSHEVYFLAFLTSFRDNFSSNWGTDKIYGRTDPIYLFQQTSRTISFEISIPSADEEEGKANLEKVRNLSRFLYPTYAIKGYMARIIDKSPLVRVKFSNLVGRTADGTGGALLGRIQTIAISPDIEAGFFDPAVKVLYPKVLNLSVTLDVLHEESPTNFPQDGDPVDPYTPEQQPTDTASQQVESEANGEGDENAGSEDGSSTAGLPGPQTAAQRIRASFLSGMQSMVEKETGFNFEDARLRAEQRRAAAESTDPDEEDAAVDSGQPASSTAATAPTVAATGAEDGTAPASPAASTSTPSSSEAAVLSSTTPPERRYDLEEDIITP